MSSKRLSAKKPPGRYHHGNLREALVKGGIELLRKEGLQALSLRAVARKVGVSQTAPYSHFADKRMLLAGVAAQGFRLFAAHLEKARSKSSDSHEAMSALAHGYVGFACKEPELFRLMFGSWAPMDGVRSPELQEAAAHAFSVLRGTVATRIGADDLALRTTGVALAALSMVHGLAHLILDGKVDPAMLGVEDRDALIQVIVSHLSLEDR